MNTKCTIIGKGGMGRLFGSIFASDQFEIHYVGREVTAAALQDSDVIVVATPTAAADSISSVLQGIANTDGKLVVCLWSCMQIGTLAFQKITFPIVYIHFLFGPDIDDLAKQNIIVSGEYRSPLFKPLLKTLRVTGAHVRTAKAEEHDQIVAYTQSLSQFSSILLGISLAQSGYNRQQLQDFASLTFRLNRNTIERIMRQKASLWTELQFENSYYQPVLAQYAANLQAMVDAIIKRDETRFTHLFNQAAVFWQLPETESVLPPATPKRSAKITPLIALGPPGTYSQLAARSFAPNAPAQLVGSIQDVIAQVADGAAVRGIIPMENAIQGIVSEALDGLFAHELVVEDELVLDIHHSLCAIEPPQQKDFITTIYSHPQALAQCRNYLRTEYPNALLVPTASTAAGMQKIADQQDLHALAIGPEFAADIYGLTILQRSIEDRPGNQTRFTVFAPKPKLGKILQFILIAVLPKEDRPGLLGDILALIQQQGVNMSQIESRPDRTKLGSYMFYIRLDMQSDDQRFKSIVAAAAQRNVTIRRMSA